MSVVEFHQKGGYCRRRLCPTQFVERRDRLQGGKKDEKIFKKK